MKTLIWLATLASIGALAYAFWSWRKRWREHQRGAEERMAGFLAQARPVAPAADRADPQEKLLLEAAAKAGQAGEPALSIELYARFLARFPQSASAAQARAALESQKQTLAKA